MHIRLNWDYVYDVCRSLRNFKTAPGEKHARINYMPTLHWYGLILKFTCIWVLEMSSSICEENGTQIYRISITKRLEVILFSPVQYIYGVWKIGLFTFFQNLNPFWSHKKSCSPPKSLLYINHKYAQCKLSLWHWNREWKIKSSYLLTY